MVEEEEFYSRLGDEVEEWQRDGIIDGPQAKAILQRHGVKRGGYRPRKVINALSILGSVLVGVGIILFFASNWKSISDFYKVALMSLVTFTTYFIGYVLRFEKKTYPGVGHALLFLGSIFVGATIFLTGQIFHINVDAHWLVLLWFIAISPLGHVFDSRPTIALNILTFTLWMGLLIATGHRGFSAESIFLLYMLFGIALYSIGQLHELTDRWSMFRIVYKGFGIFFILASYFYFSIRPSTSYYLVEGVKFGPIPQLLLVIFALFAAVSLLSNISKRVWLKSTRYEFYVLLAALAGGIVLFVINIYPSIIYEEVGRYGRTYFEPSSDIKTLLFIVFNLFLFGLSIGTISIGYYKNQATFVNIGILFFALGVLHIYLTHFHSMLPRSVAMIIGGIVLLLLATYLEKKRRSLLSAMGRSEQ